MPTSLITDSHIAEDHCACKFYADKIAASQVDKMHIVWTRLTGKDALSGYVGVFVNIKVATKAVVFLRFGRQHSRFDSLFGKNITAVLQCRLDDTSSCKPV